MSLLNIGKFAFILFIMQVLAGTLISLFWSEPDTNKQFMWLFRQYGLYTLISTIVFIFLGFKSDDKPYISALVVAMIAVGLGVLTSAMLAGEFLDPFAIMLDIPAILFSIFLGTSIGIRIRNSDFAGNISNR